MSPSVTVTFMEIFNRSKVLKYICLQAFNSSSTNRYCGTQIFFSFYKQTTYKPLSKWWSFCLCFICNTAFAGHMVALFINTLIPTKHRSSLFRGKGSGIYFEEWDGKSLVFWLQFLSPNMMKITKEKINMAIVPAVWGRKWWESGLFSPGKFTWIKPF